MYIEKVSLAGRTSTALQSAIQRGEFGEVLPPERKLCETLGVSRPVLRDALANLEGEGLIELRGRRRVVLKREAVSGCGGQCEIRLLARHQVDAFGNEILQLHDFLAESFAPSGIGVHMEISAAAFDTAAEFHLDKLVASRPNAVWLLLRSTERMQRWFEKSGVPCAVMGGLYADIRLPSVDIDYPAICRHAASLLRRRGHQAVAVIRPETELPGDKASLEAFRSAWEAPAGGKCGGVLRDETHDGTPEGLCKVAGRLLTSRDAPRSWFVFGSCSVLTLLSQLAHFRMRPGHDVHLLSRDSDPYFEFFRPKIAHYRRELLKYKKTLARVALGLLEGRRPKPLSTVVFGEFIEGGSLGMF